MSTGRCPSGEMPTAPQKLRARAGGWSAAAAATGARAAARATAPGAGARAPGEQRQEQYLLMTARSRCSPPPTSFVTPSGGAFGDTQRECISCSDGTSPSLAPEGLQQKRSKVSAGTRAAAATAVAAAAGAAAHAPDDPVGTAGRCARPVARPAALLLHPARARRRLARRAENREIAALSPLAVLAAGLARHVHAPPAERRPEVVLKRVNRQQRAQRWSGQGARGAGRRTVFSTQLHFLGGEAERAPTRVRAAAAAKSRSMSLLRGGPRRTTKLTLSESGACARGIAVMTSRASSVNGSAHICTHHSCAR